MAERMIWLFIALKMFERLPFLLFPISFSFNFDAFSFFCSVFFFVSIIIAYSVYLYSERGRDGEGKRDINPPLVGYVQYQLVLFCVDIPRPKRRTKTKMKLCLQYAWERLNHTVSAAWFQSTHTHILTHAYWDTSAHAWCMCAHTQHNNNKIVVIYTLLFAISLFAAQLVACRHSQKH